MNKDYFKTIYVLSKKELLAYFNSPIAYIFIAVFLVVGNWLFFSNFYLINQTSVREYFTLLPWLFLFLSPAITMRLWAEEKKTGTIEFLLTLPVTDWQVVLAKFFSALAFISTALALTLTLPITVNNLGNLDWGPVVGAYLGALFLAGSYLSLGLFISSLTKNQIIAFLLSLVGCFAFFIISSDFILATSPSLVAPVLKFMGLGSHFSNISRGIIDTKDVIYYISFITFFLWLNARVIESRNWK